METVKVTAQSDEQIAYLWKWLAGNPKSRSLGFVKVAHYTGNWTNRLLRKWCLKLLPV